MTLAPEKPQTRQDVAVRFSPDGTPMAIRHDGRIWMVDPDVHTAHWQVQATLPAANAELRTFTLRREPRASQWQIESIS